MVKKKNGTLDSFFEKITLQNLNLFLQIIVIVLTDKTKTNKSDFFKTAIEYFIESVKEPFSKFFKSEFSLPLTKNGTFN
jgi:hypothetical protein